MSNLYSITTNQAAIIGLFRVTRVPPPTERGRPFWIAMAAAGRRSCRCRSVLVHSHDRRVNHLHRRVMSGGQCSA